MADSTESREIARLRKHGLVTPTASELHDSSGATTTTTTTTKLVAARPTSEPAEQEDDQPAPAPKRGSTTPAATTSSGSSSPKYEKFEGAGADSTAAAEEARMRRLGLFSGGAGPTSSTSSSSSTSQASATSSRDSRVVGSSGSAVEPPRWPKEANVKRLYEMEVFVELNNVRRDPAAYASYLEELRKDAYREDGSFRVPGTNMAMKTREGRAAVDEAIAFLRNEAKPTTPLLLSDDLSMATLDLVRDNGPLDLNGSHMSDGTNAQERILKHCKPTGHMAETVAIGPFTGKLAVAHWIVDDGLSARPHRDSILSPNMHFVGIAAGPHKSMHVMCVCTFVENLHGDARAGAVSVTQAPTEHTSGKLVDTPDGKGFLIKSIPLNAPREALSLWKRPGNELHLQKVTKNEKGDERIENYRWHLPIPFRWQDVNATYDSSDKVVTVVINKQEEASGAHEITKVDIPAGVGAGDDVEMETKQTENEWVFVLTPSKHDEEVTVSIDSRTISFECVHRTETEKGVARVRATNSVTLPIIPAEDAFSVTSKGAQGFELHVLKKPKNLGPDNDTPVKLQIQ